MSVSCTVSDIARYWSKFAEFNLLHLYLFVVAVGLTLLEFYPDLWHKKTRIPEL